MGSGRDVKDCRPHRRGETKVANALPRAVSSGGRGQGDTAIEGTEQAFSSPGCPSLDDRKGVTPGSPVRSGTICTCRTQAESTSTSKDGDTGPDGRRVCAQRRRKRFVVSPAHGRMVGKGMLLSHSTLLSESGSSERCSVPRQVHMQGHG